MKAASARKFIGSKAAAIFQQGPGYDDLPLLSMVAHLTTGAVYGAVRDKDDDPGDL